MPADRKAGAYGEVVGHGVARRNGALGDLEGAVHLVGAILEEAVEVQRGGLIAEIVVDVDNDGVVDVGVDGRDGPLAVDANGLALKGAVWVGRDPSDGKVVGDDGSLGGLEQSNESGPWEDAQESCDGHGEGINSGLAAGCVRGRL